MFPNLMVVPIALVVLATLSCEGTRNKRGRRKNDIPDKAIWKKEYEEELTDAMLNGKKRENYTRSAQTGFQNENDVVIEKLMESITSSEKYLKKVDSIEFRLNRLDIEIHEKTNTILKLLHEISKSVRSDTCSEKVDSTLVALKADLNSMKFSPLQRSEGNTPGEGVEYHIDSALDTRLTFIEDRIKNVQTNVESIVSTISEVKNRQYSRTVPNKSDMTNPVDTMAVINEFRRVIREHKPKKCECNKGTMRVDRSERYPTDCHEIQVQGFNVSGIYKIRPDDMEPFYVLCDLTTAGGGWTVFQNRFDGSQDFYKGWSDYQYGFGNLAGEFWLGLEKLNYLTNQKLYELRIEMETQHDQEAYAGYSVFTVGPEHEGYRISTLGTFYGSAGDSLSYHAGQKFSTFDADNDEWKEGACATEHGGAWWYKECDKSNLNGKYSTSPEENRGQSIYWISFKGPNTPLTKTKMMIRPLPASKPIDYMEETRKLIGGQDKLSYNSENSGPRTQKVIGKPDAFGSHIRYRFDEPIADAYYPNYV